MGYTSGGNMLPNKARKLSKKNNTHHEMNAPFVNMGLRRDILRANHTKNNGNNTLVIERPKINPQSYAEGPSLVATKLAVM
ncbi:MAG: hypothetical protein DHS20C09_11970 [marine bacterium B5-7]|nr:MAG: hypothetical protein DHS20C09_11970 [marine bacterium B5-7]